MTLYIIGGLGADERVFEKLNLKTHSICIKWIQHDSKDSLKDYALRLSKQINKNEEFGLIGVSFGGIIAIELSNILKPKCIILVSSVSKSEELPFKYLRRPFSKLIKLIPNRFVKPPQFIMNFMFGAVDKELLSKIIKDTDPHFIKWALHLILTWRGSGPNENLIRIHGTNDRLIPLKGVAKMIDNGGHFMIVDKADEISNYINEYVKGLK